MIGKAIHSLLENNTDVTDLVASRIYPIVREQTDRLPAITYQVISAPRYHANSGPIGLVRGRIQINCFAATQLAAAELAAVVRGVLDGYQGSPESVRIENAMLEDESDLPVIDPGNERMNVYAKRLDFFVLYKE